MAWHIFEKLLESVANYSPFIGKIWITFLFMFRLIMVASIGDTVYSDEQSAFKCNTLQPGCENVCFNHFSPISQIRFWAVQILFVGTPSVMFMVFAMHRITKIPPSSSYKKSDEDSLHNDDDTGNKMLPAGVSKRLAVRDNFQNENSSHGTQLPRYDDLVLHGSKASSRSSKSSKNNKDDIFYKTNGPKTLSERLNQADFIAKKYGGKKADTKLAKKENTAGVKKKIVYKHDSSEVVKTPGIVRAYAVQIFARTFIEAGFLYLQYHLYKFEVNEMYVCEGHPCPRVVECFVSRPMEKTYFLRFMYAMTILSLVLNTIEIYTLIYKWTKKAIYHPQSSKSDRSFSSDDRLPMEEIVIERSRHGRARPILPNTYPDLGPFPRSHDNSFGDSSGDDTMDSDYRFYDI